MFSDCLTLPFDSSIYCCSRSSHLCCSSSRRSGFLGSCFWFCCWLPIFSSSSLKLSLECQQALHCWINHILRRLGCFQLSDLVTLGLNFGINFSHLTSLVEVNQANISLV